MNIQTRNHGENQVIISAEDLQKLIEIAEKIEPIEIIEELPAEEKMKEEAFAKKLLVEGFISSIPARDETDEDDNFEPMEFEGEPLSEQIIRERR
ncbi:MAG: hypothetical protein ACR2N3_05755 [Pyrinomonadaceae bacterium]